MLEIFFHSGQTVFYRCVTGSYRVMHIGYLGILLSDIPYTLPNYSSSLVCRTIRTKCKAVDHVNAYIRLRYCSYIEELKLLIVLVRNIRHTSLVPVATFYVLTDLNTILSHLNKSPFHLAFS